MDKMSVRDWTRFYDSEEAYQLQGLDDESVLRPYMAVVAQEMLRSFGPQRVLDVGASRGYLVEAFRHLGCEAFGVELSGHALRQALPEAKPYLVQATGDGSYLPFADGAFDAVTGLEVIEHLIEPGSLVQEMSRVTRQGGIVFITTPVLPFESRLWRYLRIQYNPVHISVHSQGYWRRLFAHADLRYIADQRHIIRKRTQLSARNSSQQHWVLRLLQTKFDSVGARLAQMLTDFAAGSMVFRKERNDDGATPPAKGTRAEEDIRRGHQWR